MYVYVCIKIYLNHIYTCTVDRLKLVGVTLLFTSLYAHSQEIAAYRLDLIIESCFRGQTLL